MAEPRGPMDPTPPLDEFLAAYEADDNEWWRAESGDHQNWFEEAVDRWRTAEVTIAQHDAQIARLRDTVLGDEIKLRAIHWARNGYCNECGGAHPCLTLRTLDEVRTRWVVDGTEDDHG